MAHLYHGIIFLGGRYGQGVANRGMLGQVETVLAGGEQVAFNGGMALRGAGCALWAGGYTVYACLHERIIAQFLRSHETS